MKLQDLFKEFTDDATLERCLEPATLMWYDKSIKGFYKYLRRINPIFNTSLNPVFNTSLNPIFNTSLNPVFNTSLNPAINLQYQGPFLYDLALVEQGFIVNANDSVSLLFRMNNTFDGILVKNAVGGFNQFDGQNKWVGYFISDRKSGYLIYDNHQHWIGIAV